jgi:hypothetical protein
MGVSMKENRLLTIVLLTMILASCGAPGATQPPGESPATATPEPPPDVSPLEWLAQAPFEAGGDGLPDILPANLPEGFEASEPEHGSAETPFGFVLYRSEVRFGRALDGEVYCEDQVNVEISSYDVPEGRIYHLDRVAEEEYSFEFWELDGHRIIRYHRWVDGRVWISGPYLIVIFSCLDTSEAAPWVDTFASLFLEMFPLN